MTPPPTRFRQGGAVVGQAQLSRWRGEVLPGFTAGGIDSPICPKIIFTNPTYWVWNLVIMPTIAPGRALRWLRKDKKIDYLANSQ